MPPSAPCAANGRATRCEELVAGLLRAAEPPGAAAVADFLTAHADLEPEISETLRAWQDYDLWTRMVERYGPALRLAEPTYLFWRGGGVAGISASANALVGARQYYDKFAMLMGPSHRRSQRLIRRITERQRLTFVDLLRCWTPATGAQAIRYWLKSNLPVSRQLLEYRWRQMR